MSIKYKKTIVGVAAFCTFGAIVGACTPDGGAVSEPTDTATPKATSAAAGTPDGHPSTKALKASETDNSERQSASTAPSPTRTTASAAEKRERLTYHPGDFFTVEDGDGHKVAEVTLNGFTKYQCNSQFSSVNTVVAMSVTAHVADRDSNRAGNIGVLNPFAMEIVNSDGTSDPVADHMMDLCVDGNGNGMLKDKPLQFIPGSTYNWDVNLGSLQSDTVTVKYRPIGSSNYATLQGKVK